MLYSKAERNLTYQDQSKGGLHRLFVYRDMLI